MAVTIEGSIQRFRGLSTDTKPEEDVKTGSVFTEVDTGARYVWTGSRPWIRQEQTIEALLNALLEVEEEILAVLKATHHGNEEHIWEEEVEIESNGI